MAANIVSRDLLAIASTISFTLPSKDYVGNNIAIPNLWAYCASIGNPVKIIFWAILVPIILGNICVPPIPGINPKVIYGNPNLAF